MEYMSPYMKYLPMELRNWNEIKRTPIQSFPVKSNMAAKSLHMAIDFRNILDLKIPCAIY